MAVARTAINRKTVQIFLIGKDKTGGNGERSDQVIDYQGRDTITVHLRARKYNRRVECLWLGIKRELDR